MRLLRSSVGVMLAMVLIGAAGPGAAQEAVQPERLPERILFVGNSFTYSNGGLGRQLEGLAASEEPSREIVSDSTSIPGATLRVHYMLSERDSAPGAVDDIRAGDYDVVVLQGDIPEWE